MKYKYFVEIFLIYLLPPLALKVLSVRVPIVPFLMLIGLVLWLVLKRQKSFDQREFYILKPYYKELKKLLIVFVLFAPIIILATYFLVPDRLFSFVIKKPKIWMLVMLLYPILSVIPQTLLFRTLFFHRYAKCFKSKNLAVVVSAALFSFGHFSFATYEGLIMTFLGGLLFSFRYEKCRSVPLSVIEHGLYGDWVFTTGLGYFVLSFIHR